MNDPAIIPPEPRPEPPLGGPRPAPATDDGGQLDRLLAAWRHWQDLRAGDAPAWARMAAFENYLSARAALRAPSPDEPSGGDAAPRGGADRKRRRHLPWMLVAAAVLATVVAAGVRPAGPDPTTRAGAGDRAPVAAQPADGPGRGPNLDFSPGR